MSLLIVLAAVAVVIALLATEQVAILYLLSTLGVAALLIVVAYADLEGARRRTGNEAGLGDDAAAIGDGRTSVGGLGTGRGATRPARARQGRA